ncbi:MAG: TetR/AcrR family transcriptional regulator [Deltaproteobacteria bacterium]|nr:TetR/AcrR family transcriptional regulator [Deltaproteobacteria bacterium]
MKRKKKPKGREQVMDALIKAAAELISKRGFAAVSVREIAARADVNHGLVHKYFGSKENLIRMSLDRLATAFRETAGKPEDFDDALRRSGKALRRHEEYSRLLLRVMIDGDELTNVQSNFDFLDNVIRLVRKEQNMGKMTSQMDARMIVAGITALGYGLQLFAPYLLPATKLDKKSREKMIGEIFQSWVSLTKT